MPDALSWTMAAVVRDVDGGDARFMGPGEVVPPHAPKVMASSPMHATRRIATRYPTRSDGTKFLPSSGDIHQH
jgi:hypothetical protein